MAVKVGFGREGGLKRGRIGSAKLIDRDIVCIFCRSQGKMHSCQSLILLVGVNFGALVCVDCFLVAAKKRR